VVASHKAHTSGHLGYWPRNHWPDGLSSDEPSLLKTTVGHVGPWWPLHVGPSAGGHNQAGVQQPRGHHVAVGEVDAAEAVEAVEGPRAAGDAAVAGEVEDAAAAAGVGGGAVPWAV
jgi:hypothetical protein